MGYAQLVIGPAGSGKVNNENCIFSIYIVSIWWLETDLFNILNLFVRAFSCYCDELCPLLSGSLSGYCSLPTVLACTDTVKLLVDQFML